MATHALDRANAALELLKNKTLTEAFSALEQNWLSTLLTSQYGDTETREQCYRNIAAVKEVRAALVRYVQDGKIEEMKNGRSE